MRIAFFTDVYSPTINGVVSSIDAFADQLRAEGHTVTIICPSYGDLNGHDDNVIRISAAKFMMYKEYRVASMVSLKLYRHMSKFRYDVVHLHSPFSIGMLGIYYARRYKLPIIYTAHTSYGDYVHYIPGVNKLLSSKRIDRLLVYFSNQIDMTIAPSNKIRTTLASGGVTKPIAVIPTGIVTGRFASGDGAAFRAQHKLGKCKVLLFVGRLAKEKNIEFLLTAFKQVQAAHPDTRLVIAGAGPVAGRLEQLCVDLTITRQVIFTGYITGDELYSAYAAADIFVMASVTETQGLVLLEAAAAGLPIVTIADDAYGAVAKAGKNALVVPMQEHQFAEAIGTLLNDASMCIAFSAASRRIASKYSIQTQTQKLLLAYQKALQNKRIVMSDHNEVELAG